MSLKDLEQYQENGYRTPTDYKDRHKSYKQELYEHNQRIKDRPVFKREESEKKVWSNVEQRNIAESDFTEEMIEKEQELYFNLY